MHRENKDFMNYSLGEKKLQLMDYLKLREKKKTFAGQYFKNLAKLLQVS